MRDCYILSELDRSLQPLGYLGCNQFKKIDFKNMITITKSKKTAKESDSHNWSFLPTVLSALLGVGIGIAMGCYFGWL